jgi:hypothetical protein
MTILLHSLCERTHHGSREPQQGQGKVRAKAPTRTNRPPRTTIYPGRVRQKARAAATVPDTKSSRLTNRGPLGPAPRTDVRAKRNSSRRTESADLQLARALPRLRLRNPERNFSRGTPVAFTPTSRAVRAAATAGPLKTFPPGGDSNGLFKDATADAAVLLRCGVEVIDV